MDKTIVLDDDLHALLLAQAGRQGFDINMLANAAIRAANKAFSDMGLRYSQDDVSHAWNETADIAKNADIQRNEGH